MGEDDRGNVLKGLGVKRRRSGGGDAPEGSAEPAPDEQSATATEASPAEAGAAARGASSGLGIKRRSGPSAAPSDASADGSSDGAGAADEDAAASGLGIKRRSATRRDAAAPASDAPPDPLAPIRGKLGNDETAVLLMNHFRSRPDLPAMLPQRLWELKRTHGYYIGDGRTERKITIGWEPAHVLFTLPTYPDGPPSFTKDWKRIEPGPNRQPGFTPDGFQVDLPYNLLGEWYFYVVFRADGQPLEEAPPEEPSADERPSRSLGLGIRRRK